MAQSFLSWTVRQICWQKGFYRSWPFSASFFFFFFFPFIHFSSTLILQVEWQHDCEATASPDKIKYITISFECPVLELYKRKDKVSLYCSCQLHLHICSQNPPLDLAFQTWSFYNNALHLAVTATERDGGWGCMWYCRVDCQPGAAAACRSLRGQQRWPVFSPAG